MADGDGGTGSARAARGDAESDADDPVAEAGEAAARLRERYDELRRVESRIDGYGRDRVEAAADAYRLAHRVLDRYEEDAVGSGDFESYVRFRGEFGEAVDVGDEVPAGDAFEAADEAVDKRRLSEGDIAAAREALEPAGEFVDLLEAYDDAVDDYRAARKAAREARKRLEARLDGLREVAEMADADLDADLSRLRGPIEAYDEAVREAFREFFKSASAREVFEFLDRADGTPFVDVDVPPTDLAEYVETHAAGEEPPATLLEYADYTNSKLEHYVDDPGALRTAVAVHRTYLERLDGEPLTLDWPPKPGDELAYEIDELVPLVGRIADDEVVATLREVRELARSDGYERLRRAAEVRHALDDPDLALIERGEADERVVTAEETRSVVDDVLAETERD
ncbi:DUF7118 family protein [Halorubrum tebenquichense]|uniref:Uncharacterized protein n=1 Tax=Halorubrum tebenquichense DSM 14210 TaxID=1227485 RepID=M0DE09_9EURY|nr:hypothetical protein [Halorubrum tebenquichense]ELZ33710.1 hypothetical protein C472_13937 [Halorubrum tebenquichense DSM 14210]